MIDYDRDFDPPAPIISVNLTRIVRSRPIFEVLALIDTGSDITAIPEDLIRKLQLYPFNRIRVEGIDATEKIAYTYAVSIKVNGHTSKEFEVIETALPFAILGRDWLKNPYLYLDGPAQKFILSGSPLVLEE